MNDLDMFDLLPGLHRRAEQLSHLAESRVEREIEGIRKAAEAAFMARGASDLEAFFAADEVARRLRGMTERHRRRRENYGGAGRARRAGP